MKKALVAYMALGLVVFAPVIPAWFVGDDWDFLLLVAPAKSSLICFIPLVGRFIRPLVMATYYFNFRLFGLRPVPYHLTLIAVHSINAWLVCLLAERLGLSRLVALGAGLIFLVFAGHSEAVSWLAGAADPWLVLLLVPTLLLFDRSLKAESGGWAMAGTCVLMGLCLLAKETAMTGAAFLAVYGASRLLLPLTTAQRQRVIVRTTVVVLITGAIAIAYSAIRSRVFGTAFGGYLEYWSTPALMALESRAFLLRSFLPPGGTLAAWWTHGYDLLAIAAVALWLGFVFGRRPDTRAGLAFLVSALAIGLVPVLPLSISIGNSVSERYVYVATVFSSILVAWFTEILFGQRRALAAAAIVVFALVHLRALERANLRWAAAGRLTRTLTGELIERVRAVPPTTRTFVTNIPDTVAGAFALRGAFFDAFPVMAPDVTSPGIRLAMIASTDDVTTTDAARVEATGTQSIAVTLNGGVFVQARGISTPEYTFDRWNRSSYAVTFKPQLHRVQLLYVTEGHLHTAAVLPGIPFGFLDQPSQNAVCDGASIRFTGWALAEQPGVRVILENADQPQGVVPIGAASWQTGTRPDVAAPYRDFPDANRAEWDWSLPCADVKRAGGVLGVRAVAVGRDGVRTMLGTRTVHSR